MAVPFPFLLLYDHMLTHRHVLLSVCTLYCRLILFDSLPLTRIVIPHVYIRSIRINTLCVLIARYLPCRILQQSQV
jgi:hypothetical protein